MKFTWGNEFQSERTFYNAAIMSSKKRKSVSQIWYICDICKSILQVKDTPLHKENGCFVNNPTLIHAYIKDDCLYTKMEIFKVEDIASLKNIPISKMNDFVFLPTDALQLMKIPIGDSVLITPKSSEAFTPFVKTAWPYGEKNLKAFVTKQVADLYALDSIDGLSVKQIKESVKFAKQMSFKCETDFDVNNEADVLNKVRDENIGNIYCVGNKFTYSHYGKLLTFMVIDIMPLFENEDKECKHKEESHVKLPELFILTQETVWKFCGKTNFDSVNEYEKENKFKKIGGLNDTVKELEEIVSLALHDSKGLTGIHITRGVLIFGPGGTGKTALVETIAQKFKISIVKIETCQIFSKFFGEAERQLVRDFEKAKRLSPSVILIDDLDTICPKTNGRNDQEKRIIATLSLLLDKLHRGDNERVLVFATTSKLSDIHKSLRRPGRFGKEIEIHVPNNKEKKEILQIHLGSINHNLGDNEVTEIADSSYGFVGADLVSLVSKAVLRKCRKTDYVSVEDFRWALTKVKPSAMREVIIEVPNVRWCDIGGQEDLKLKLKQAVEWPLKYEDSFRKLGIVPPRGLLMFGPPGCSKTMIAKALATESKLNFISVKGPELFSKWVGESEKAVREVFRRARQVAPSVVFFDELDAIAGERNTSREGTSVEERVLAQLLTELDGVEPLGNVMILGATNRLDRIDPALLRPGRFDRIVYVPLPDAETRRQIFNIQFKQTPVAKDIDLDELVQKSEGYSGAEIVAVSHEAALKALEEDFTCSFVKREHFLTAFNIIIPRTPQSLLNIYEKYLHK